MTSPSSSKTGAISTAPRGEGGGRGKFIQEEEEEEEEEEGLLTNNE